MGQSSYVYILWLVILAAGLWVIIGFGSLLHAREDLAGEWKLTPEQPAAGIESSWMKVEQSGRYVSLSLDGGQSLRMKMIEETTVERGFAEHKRIILSGNDTRATFEGRHNGDLWRFSLDGAVRGDFIALLTDRTYPRPAPATQKAHAR